MWSAVRPGSLDSVSEISQQVPSHGRGHPGHSRLLLSGTPPGSVRAGRWSGLSCSELLDGKKALCRRRSILPYRGRGRGARLLKLQAPWSSISVCLPIGLYRFLYLYISIYLYLSLSIYIYRYIYIYIYRYIDI